MVGRPSWMDAAACSDHDATMFFPENDTDTTADAVRVCRSCRVRIDCLEFAIDRNERYGIWGGTTPLQRDRLRNAAAELGNLGDDRGRGPRSRGE